MESYVFAALDSYTHSDLQNIEKYLLKNQNFHELAISSEAQLQVLFRLLKID